MDSINAESELNAVLFEAEKSQAAGRAEIAAR